MSDPATLDFGVNDLDSQTTDLSTIEPSSDEKQEASRYDQITDLPTKRKQIIYDIKKGILNAREYPLIFKKFSEIIDKTSDGRFLYTNPQSTYYHALRTKLITFVMTGKLGDALASSSLEEIKRIAREIADEVYLHIPLTNDHPTRKINALEKNGDLQDIIDFNLKKKHYDVFDRTWYMKNIKPLVMEYIYNYRKSDHNEMKGKLEDLFRESLQNIREKLKQIYG